MANRLGFIHVDEMLDQLTPEEFNERYAAHVLTGGGETQHFVARILAAIHNLIPAYVATKGGNVPMRKIEDFLPELLQPPRKPTATRSVSPEELAKQLGCL